MSGTNCRSVWTPFRRTFASRLCSQWSNGSKQFADNWASSLVFRRRPVRSGSSALSTQRCITWRYCWRHRRVMSSTARLHIRPRLWYDIDWLPHPSNDLLVSQSCPELTDVLQKGDFVEFTKHLEGLSAIYQINADKWVKWIYFDNNILNLIVIELSEKISPKHISLYTPWKSIWPLCRICKSESTSGHWYIELIFINIT